MMAWKKLCLIFLLTFDHVSAYSSGAPSSACSSMMPGHGSGSQNAENRPYTLTPLGQMIEVGKSLTLNLTASDGAVFKGFLVQAFISGTDEPFGTFETASGMAKSINCGSGTSNAATHKSSDPKSNIVLSWKADGNDKAGKTVEFKFTVVQDYSTYWVKQDAANLVKLDESETFAEPESEPETEPESESEPESEREPQGASAQGEEDDDEPLPEAYEGCNEDQGCFGTKYDASEDCVKTGTCKIMSSYAYDQANQRYNFKLSAKSSDSNEYMAVGLSKDEKMGGDLVISCGAQAGRVPQISYNNGKSNVLGKSDDLINAIATKEVDGISTCEFSLPEKFTFSEPEKTEFNLNEGKLHLLLASGSMSSGRLSKHKSRIASKAPVNLASVSKVEIGQDSYFDQLHACLMILAWMGSAASGMLIARYYKKTWRDIRLGEKDLWFRLHQIFMGSTVGLTLGGFIVIVTEHGGDPLLWTSIKQNPHPVFGLICFITTMIQPMMAALRPHPESSSRWIFNWAHWIFGNVAFGFAILAIFFGLEYTQIGTPTEATYVMIIYIIFHFIVHILLTFERVYHQRSNRVEEMNAAPEFKDDPGTNSRKALAYIYIPLVWILALVILAWVIHMKIIDSTNEEYEGNAEPEN